MIKGKYIMIGDNQADTSHVQMDAGAEYGHTPRTIIFLKFINMNKIRTSNVCCLMQVIFVYITARLHLAS